MVRPFRTDEYEPIEHARVTSSRCERQMRTVAPAPQREPFVAERLSHVAHVVRALPRVVGFEANATCAKLLGDPTAGALDARQPLRHRTRRVERQIVPRRRVEVRARAPRPSLIDANHIAIEQLPHS